MRNTGLHKIHTKYEALLWIEEEKQNLITFGYKFLGATNELILTSQLKCVCPFRIYFDFLEYIDT